MLMVSIYCSYASAEHKEVKGQNPLAAGEPFRGLSCQRQLAARDRPLRHHVAAEAEQLGRAATGLRGDFPGLLHEVLLLDQPAEVLLVQAPSGQRLHRVLQLEQREAGRHQFKHHRAVFDLGAQTRDPGGEDAAMVVSHRFALDRCARLG